MFVSCQCYVLSGSCVCVELITRPEESFRVWVCLEYDRENFENEEAWPSRGCCVIGGGGYLSTLCCAERLTEAQLCLCLPPDCSISKRTNGSPFMFRKTVFYRTCFKIPDTRKKFSFCFRIVSTPQLTLGSFTPYVIRV